MSGPPPRPSPSVGKRRMGSPTPSNDSPTKKASPASTATSQKVIVALSVRAADRWASASVNDQTKWYSGKAANQCWLSVNATLRTMTPEVWELDKRKEEHRKMLNYYPATFGNARAEWEFTCEPEDFIQGVYNRLKASNASDIERFTYSINDGGLKLPRDFATLESMIEAVREIPKPPAHE